MEQPAAQTSNRVKQRRFLPWPDERSGGLKQQTLAAKRLSPDNGYLTLRQKQRSSAKLQRRRRVAGMPCADDVE
jgi:hypothetical protein